MTDTILFLLLLASASFCWAVALWAAEEMEQYWFERRRGAILTKRMTTLKDVR